MLGVDYGIIELYTMIEKEESRLWRRIANKFRSIYTWRKCQDYRVILLASNEK